MYEEKSRGSGRGSRKTRIEGYGWVTRMLAAAAVRGKMGQRASSCTRRRVGDVAVGVARLGLKSRVGDPGGRQPRPVGEKISRHACSGHGTVQGRARWTPKRRIYMTMGRPERAKA
ncbi:hypothetical protein CDL15_Pgr027117 [Punica granatum]|uniref:Uncharacterized protein n=1 Tax=Punica granatum TaxID=22663 RepID=A0A218WXD9_PUNGR|nr:hypothetical protein CDL15_Pgr027117 [Punica granatum]